MGWLQLRTIDDFQIIDILNEVDCKCLVKSNIFFLINFLFIVHSCFVFSLKVDSFNKLISIYTFWFTGGHRR
jgi:hypothetical protein